MAIDLITLKQDLKENIIPLMEKYIEQGQNLIFLKGIAVGMRLKEEEQQLIKDNNKKTA